MIHVNTWQMKWINHYSCLLYTSELIDNMKSSIDLGVTSFDTAEIYADTLCESQIDVYKRQMRDLEIRGAGNLLGQAQSGHMEAVGYDLYCKMLNEACLLYTSRCV